MKKSIFFIITFYLLSFNFYGCGYTTRVYIGPYQTIYVAPFKNSVDIAKEKSEYSQYRTYYPLMESTITQKVVDRFIFDGSLSITREEKADLLLSGELISYQRDALKYAENNEDVTEYRITLWVNLTLKKKDGNIVWQKNNFAGDSTYMITGSQAKTEKSALDDAITDLSRRIVEAVVEAW